MDSLHQLLFQREGLLRERGPWKSQDLGFVMESLRVIRKILDVGKILTLTLNCHCILVVQFSNGHVHVLI